MLNKKQLNKCSAWIYYDERNIADSNYIALVSYNTLICVWQRKGRVLYVGPNYNCSATTRRHVSMFLDRMCFGIYYRHIKECFTKAFNPYTGEIINTEMFEQYYEYDNLIYPSFHNNLFDRGWFSAYDLEYAIKENRLG